MSDTDEFKALMKSSKILTDEQRQAVVHNLNFDAIHCKTNFGRSLTLSCVLILINYGKLIFSFQKIPRTSILYLWNLRCRESASYSVAIIIMRCIVWCVFINTFRDTVDMHSLCMTDFYCRQILALESFIIRENIMPFPAKKLQLNLQRTQMSEL